MRTAPGGSFDSDFSYQPQFRGTPPEGPPNEDEGASRLSDSTAVQDDPMDPESSLHDSTGENARKGSNPDGQPEAKLKDHVFQTIFLDKDGSKDLWTDKEIRSDKRIYEKWWKQVGFIAHGACS